MPSRATHPGTILLWAGLWLLPLPLLHIAGQRLLFDLATYIAKLAVVTFGEAYAVLAYMAQEVVESRAWRTAPQMIDALGLAETMPGPLILVTQFVAHLAAHQAGGPRFGLLAGGLALWMTFVPCFLWILAGAPHVQTLPARPRLRAALAAITAAVVGVIANLSLWFALHVLFADVVTLTLGPLTPDLPSLSGLRPDGLFLTAAAAVLLPGLKCGMPLCLAPFAGLGWMVGLI